MNKAFLGQNFLVDEDWQKKIVSYFEPAGAFGEIGPGYGALTQHLEQKYDEFVVFEIDPWIIAEHQNKKYKVIEGSFLDWDFSLEGKPVQNYSIIGNLPYETGSKMLKNIAEHGHQIDHFVFMLQREVVERVCAKPKTRDFASFSVIVQGQFDVEALDLVGPEFFRPRPKVDSQIMRARRRKNPHPINKAYLKFLFSCFLNKRKTFRNALKPLYNKEQIDAVYDKYGFGVFTRAEEINVDLWPQLFEDLKSGKEDG
jgi:16S rRNA (adenine1518-N6/adenine1519-N6)-dimethyltransferase